MEWEGRNCRAACATFRSEDSDYCEHRKPAKRKHSVWTKGNIGLYENRKIRLWFVTGVYIEQRPFWEVGLQCICSGEPFPGGGWNLHPITPTNKAQSKRRGWIIGFPGSGVPKRTWRQKPLKGILRTPFQHKNATLNLSLKSFIVWPAV